MPDSNFNMVSNAGAQTDTFTPVTPVQQFVSEQKVGPSVTSLAELEAYSKGTVVRLPDFAEGQPFYARVRRPSLLKLAANGRVPNSLLASAGTMFASGASGFDTDDENMLKEMYDVCMVMAKSCLLEPTVEQIEGAGMELTDEQLMAIFSYTQRGNVALEQFRQE